MPNLGDELFRLADNVARAVPYFTQMADENDQILASQRTNALIRDWAKKAPELLTGNPDGWVDSMSQYLQTQRDALADGMTPGQIQHFSNMTDQWFTQETVRVGAARQNALQPYHLTQLQASGKMWAETAGQAPGAYDLARNTYREELDRNPWIDNQQRGALMAGFESDVGLYNAMADLQQNGPLQAEAKLNAGGYTRLGENLEQFGKIVEEAKKDAIATNTTSAIQQFDPVHTNFWEASARNPEGDLRAQLSQARIAKDLTMANPLVSDEEKKRQESLYKAMLDQVKSVEEKKVSGDKTPPEAIVAAVYDGIQQTRATWNTGTDTRNTQARAQTLATLVNRLKRENPNYDGWITRTVNGALQAEINFQQDPQFNILQAAVSQAKSAGQIDAVQAEMIESTLWRELQQTRSAGGQTPFAVAISNELVLQKANSLIMAFNPATAPEGLRLMVTANASGTIRQDTTRGSEGQFGDSAWESDYEKMVSAVNRGELSGWKAFPAPQRQAYERNVREAVVDFVQRAPEELVRGQYFEEVIGADGRFYAAIIPKTSAGGVDIKNRALARFFAPVVEGQIEKWYEVNPTTGDRLSAAPVTINRQRQTNRNTQIQPWGGQ